MDASSEAARKWSVLLAHADRRWQAEVENARRLAERAKTLITLVSALLGLGFLKFGSLEVIEPTLLFHAIRSFLAAGVALLVAALLLLLGFRRQRDQARPLASRSLAWPNEARLNASKLGEAAALEIACSVVTQAAVDLQIRNTGEQGRIDSGQLLLVFAAFCAGVSMLLHLAFARVV